MKLSNAFLIYAVWAVALTLMAASFAAAQPPDTPLWSMRGWDDSGSVYMWFDAGFLPNGNSMGGNVWLMDSDRIPVGTDPVLILGHDATMDFQTGQIDWSEPGVGLVDGSLNDLFVVHNESALALDFTNTLSGQWLVPEASACALFLVGLVCLALGRRRC